MATGSPFAPVQHGNRRIVIGQGNNAFIFPGIGLGVIVAEAREVTDSMFAVAAERLASEVRPADLASGSLFPPVDSIRSVTAKIAEAVVREARELGLANRVIADADIPQAVVDAMWKPDYLPLEAKR